MKVILFLGLYFLFSSIAWSSSLEAEFEIDNKIKTLKEGDVVSATLRVWPIEDVDFAEFKKLQSTNLFDSFYLADVESIAPSINNSDVIELKGSFLVMGKINPSKLSINYHDQLVHVRFKEVLINQLDKKSNEFLVEDQDVDHNYATVSIIVLVLIIFSLLYFKREKIKQLFKKKEKVDEKVTFARLFLLAKSREDFETLYLQKEKWIKLLKEVTPAHHDFFKVLNEHQYKKEWSTAIKNEVEESFEQIRRSFNE